MTKKPQNLKQFLPQLLKRSSIKRNKSTLFIFIFFKLIQLGAYFDSTFLFKATLKSGIDIPPGINVAIGENWKMIKVPSVYS